MTELGFLVQVPDQDRLRPGLPVLTLGYAVLASQRIGETAKPYMEAIAKRYQGAVSLGVRDGLNMLYLQRCQGSSIILADLSVGSRVPLAYSATGWAYLAAVPEKDRKLLLAEIRASDRQKWTAIEPSFEASLKDFQKDGIRRQSWLAASAGQRGCRARSIAGWLGPANDQFGRDQFGLYKQGPA